MYFRFSLWVMEMG
uniref:Uncharacterized protein n=1 Tax=Arundo donax TaxID=35708 RepID=A0A0A9BM48_ARUDO